MIGWADIHRGAVDARALSGGEEERRQAVSALYYALFHRLCAEGAKLFRSGGTALECKVARAFNHSQMKRCAAQFVVAARRGAFDGEMVWIPLERPSAAIGAVAAAFIELQQGRHLADYDLQAELPQTEHLRLLEIAEHAHWRLDELTGEPELTIFLAAMLLSDRWGRRG